MEDSTCTAKRAFVGGSGFQVLQQNIRSFGQGCRDVVVALFWRFPINGG